MKRTISTLALLLMIMFMWAAKPLYSSRYTVIQGDKKRYTVKVDIFKSHLMVGAARCAVTNEIGGWRIYNGGTSGNYTSLYYVDLTNFEMKYVIQQDGEKMEFPMANLDTSLVVTQFREFCPYCTLGRIAVEEPWNNLTKTYEQIECQECHKTFLKSDGHRHENCTHCGGKGYYIRQEQAPAEEDQSEAEEE